MSFVWRVLKVIINTPITVRNMNRQYNLSIKLRGSKYYKYKKEYRK